MILADTSVWIDFFSARENPQTERLVAAVAAREIVMGDLILIELLQGARTKSALATIDRKLAPIPCEVLCGPYLAVKAAENYRTLRQRGITVRGTIDVIIATWCIEAKTQLLHNDRDYDPIELHLDLAVWR